MTVNALERIAVLRDLASDIIAEIELLAASNPNLIPHLTQFMLPQGL